ncbi:formimidoylglutamate deiminase [Roseomonas indoligenes]|uniref:Formimidoylglutamate deiminase n=1 Tax=Roseomonas indoligenes TaxID=2820811 RepID=A0A940MYP0_9PROT|nr:formimidoylglutamate deiminase [Pararoseomonas indoligenes]MBP0493284.1 formimidoylglutamate deiminase [Pararoseomonas indoligenes]
MTRRRLLLEDALLPSGWAQGVVLEIESGWIRAVQPGGSPEGCERVPGIALPGMPNLHSHTFQRAMAGLAEIRGPGEDSFWTWRNVMYGFLGRLTPEDVQAVAAQAMVEMLEGGFTALTEFHYLHHDPAGRPYDNPAEMGARVAAAAGETGIGLTLLPVLYTYGGFGAQPATSGQARFLHGVDGYARLLEASAAAIAPLEDPALGMAPHSLRAVAPEGLRAMLDIRSEGPVHIHVAEQMREVEDCLAWSGQRPVAWLLSHTPVDPRWCLVHATHMDPSEVEGLARTGAVAGLCPITEANLGDGVFEAPAFLAAGGRFGVGSDSNVEIAAPGELRMLEYSQRLARRGRNLLASAPGASTGRSLYESALAGGAQAAGRRIGRIEPGHRADLVVLDRTHPSLALAEGDGWLDTLTFSAGPAAVDTVIVGGRSVVTGGRHHRREEIAGRYRAAMAGLAG